MTKRAETQEEDRRIRKWFQRIGRELFASGMGYCQLSHQHIMYLDGCRFLIPLSNNNRGWGAQPQTPPGPPQQQHQQQRQQQPLSPPPPLQPPPEAKRMPRPEAKPEPKQMRERCPKRTTSMLRSPCRSATTTGFCMTMPEDSTSTTISQRSHDPCPRTNGPRSSTHLAAVPATNSRVHMLVFPTGQQ